MFALSRDERGNDFIVIGDNIRITYYRFSNRKEVDPKISGEDRIRIENISEEAVLRGIEISLGKDPKRAILNLINGLTELVYHNTK